METLLQQEGVRYWGGVGHERMADAYAETGFYVYPTETPETAPINLMKAQVLNLLALPVNQYKH
jgi:hypothetical protein